MSTTTTMMKSATKRHLLAGLTAGLGLLALTATAQAQEILLTGPLAGAPAVRELRLYRQGRIELAPTMTFTILDEYKRTYMPGLQITYNFTDWLGVGLWGGYGIGVPAALSDHIQRENAARHCPAPADRNSVELSTVCLLTATNLGTDFKDQIASINWVLAAPQLTFVPFRGKLALFSKIYTDTEIFFFLAPAFIGLNERAECDAPGGKKTPCINSFGMSSRVAVTGTFGLGLSFFLTRWLSLGVEYRALPFAWNTGGFDTAGGGRDKEFPDGRINGEDRKFIFNQLLSVRASFWLPPKNRVSE